MTAGPERMTLSDEHLNYLRSAAITADVAESAGVYTATEPEHLPPGLAHWAPGLPGIVFPWLRASRPGAVIRERDILWQLRPDTPITVTADDGRVERRKYLFPAKAEMAVNVHPLVWPLLSSPEAPILLVEGTKQTLAAVSALTGGGIMVAGLSGCWGWKQRGAVLNDMQAIPWKGREVLLCLDADVAGNRNVYDAATELRTWLTSTMGAEVVRLIRLPGGGSTGLDDVLTQTVDPRDAMANLIDTARAARTARDKWPSRPPLKKSGAYFSEDGGLLAEKTATALLEKHPCALAANRTIAVYDSGRYVLHSSEPLKQYVTDMLGDRYKPGHLTTVTDMVEGKLRIEGKIIPVRPECPWLNVRNGMLDLLTGELHEHSPEHMSVTQIPIEWNPDATCPTYESWLKSVVHAGQMEDLEEVTATMLDMLHTPSKAIFLYGPSLSGKSTYLRIMKAVMGPENYSSATLHQLNENRFIASGLYGKKLNVGSDLSPRHIDDLSIWKMLTGDDSIVAERKNGHPFDFSNQALFAFSANELPSVSESSNAYFNRVKPFSFPVTFEGRVEPGIEKTIMEDELPGVLRRWQLAFIRLRKRGSFAQTVAEVATDFKVKTDRVQLWMTEEKRIVYSIRGKNGVDVALSGGASVGTATGTSKAELYDEYRTWIKDNGYTALGKQKFLSRLTSMNGVIEVRIKPSKIRGLNIVDLVGEDHGTAHLVAVVANRPPIYETDERDKTRNEDQKGVVLTQIGSRENPPKLPPEPVVDDLAVTGSEPAPVSAPTPLGEPIKIEYSVLTEPVYSTIAANPMITIKAACERLRISPDDLKAEVDRLSRAGVLARRQGKRGFEVFVPIVEHIHDYVPCSDPAWVNTSGSGSDEPATRELLRFSYSCVRCEQDDDERSEYFPVCAQCRQIAGD